MINRFNIICFFSYIYLLLTTDVFLFLLEEKIGFIVFLNKLNIFISLIDFGKLFHIKFPLYFTECSW